MLWDWSIALLLCIAAVGGFQSAAAKTNDSYSTSAAYLEAALDRYLTIEKQGGWPKVPKGPALRIGSFGSSVARLKERLAVTNDLAERNSNPLEFGDDLLFAVMHFQFRHGLAIDGVVGQHTRAALNISVEERIQQMTANLARLQALPLSNKKRMILINVAGFELNVIENGKEVLSFPIIVGRVSRPTPVFSSFITKIIVNPYWRVPRRIAIRDILPKLKRDPSYLKTQKIRIYKASGGSEVEVPADSVDWHSMNARNFRYVLVQDPGPLNALGRVKFRLPNKHSVLIHDTPAQELFNHKLRAFSSGCIRVSKAVELAKHLLKQDSESSVHAMAEALQNGKTTRIALTSPVPTHLIYLTAWADENGHAHFRDDIYVLDGLVYGKQLQQKNARHDVARAYDRASTPVACHP